MPIPSSSRGGLVDLRDWALKRDVDELCGLGSRFVYEVFSELGATSLSRTEIETVIRRFVETFCPPRKRR